MVLVSHLSGSKPSATHANCRNHARRVGARAGARKGEGRSLPLASPRAISSFACAMRVTSARDSFNLRVALAGWNYLSWHQ